jgi:nucleoside-diphosphate-sugar epimerase
MRGLVTGSAGLIGSELVARFVEEVASVTLEELFDKPNSERA